MAEGMAHEIGNCLVPLSTHQQLMAQKLDDPEFRASLTTAMGEGVRRISRLSNQMLFLTRDGVGRADSIPMTTLVEEAFREVQNSVGDHKALLLCESGGKRFTIKGNKPALKHAFSELILNALQANPGDPQVQVNLTTVSDASGTWLRVEVHDTGKGFSPEVAKRATEPFFTTRNVGLGLGLTVTRKILEAHGGRLEIAPEGRANTVALFLPMSLEPEETGPAAVTTRSSTPVKGKGSRPAAGVQE
jgi:signal transduction histidine kinase